MEDEGYKFLSNSKTMDDKGWGPQSKRRQNNLQDRGFDFIFVSPVAQQAAHREGVC